MCGRFDTQKKKKEKKKKSALFHAWRTESNILYLIFKLCCYIRAASLSRGIRCSGRLPRFADSLFESQLSFSLKTLIITHKYINRKTYLNIKINKHTKSNVTKIKINHHHHYGKNGTSLFSRLPFSHLFLFSSPHLCQRRSTTTLFSLFRSLSFSLSLSSFVCLLRNCREGNGMSSENLRFLVNFDFPKIKNLNLFSLNFPFSLHLYESQALFFGSYVNLE